jgi:hypothetical protein
MDSSFLLLLLLLLILLLPAIHLHALPICINEGQPPFTHERKKERARE